MVRDRGWRATLDVTGKASLQHLGKDKKGMRERTKKIFEEESYRQRDWHVQRP